MRSAARWTALSLLALAAAVAPFLLFEAEIAAWTQRLLASQTNRAAAGGVLALLLASDIVLPVPSSLISTALGYVLGLAAGAAVGWAGMTAGALLGYWLGARAGRPLTRRFVGERELDRAAAAHQRWGGLSIVVFRSVPVLAEASALFAGVAGMPLAKFLLSASLANLGVSLVYAWIGAYALETESFLLAFAGSVAFPGAAMLLARGRKKRR